MQSLRPLAGALAIVMGSSAIGGIGYALSSLETAQAVAAQTNHGNQPGSDSSFERQGDLSTYKATDTLNAEGAPELNRPSGRWCTTPRRMNKMFTIDTSKVDTENVVRVGNWQVNFRDSNWKARDPRHASTSQIFHAGSWLVPYYEQNPRRAVELLVEQAKTQTDPGGGVPSLERSKRGWTESQVTKRMHTVMCLYQHSKDPRLVEIVENLAKANMDPRRYYGPPGRAPHNHGVLANEVLRGAGELFGRTSWTTTANERDRIMLSEMFEKCGITGEQSSSYHVVNVKLWQRLLRYNPQGAATLAQAHEALGAIMRPDGDMEYIGDGFAGRHTKEDLAELATPRGAIFCPKYGWAAMHIGGAAPSQHTLRFGKPLSFHGHHDHAAPTWWVGGYDGKPVLVDRGNYTKALTKRNTWAHSEEAHSTLTASRGEIQGRSTGSREITEDAVTYRVNTQLRQDSWTRELTFRKDKSELLVQDRAPRGAYGKLVQRWHLAPGWQASKTHTAANGEHRLDITCEIQGKSVPVMLRKVEHYTGDRKLVQALEATCVAKPGQVLKTQLRVNANAS